MKKLIEIDEDLFKAIQKNAKKMSNSMNKEIGEMLWLSLQPRTKQIKKVEAIRSSTLTQLKNKRKKRKSQKTKFSELKIYYSDPNDEIINNKIINPNERIIEDDI